MLSIGLSSCPSGCLFAFLFNNFIICCHCNYVSENVVGYSVIRLLCVCVCMFALMPFSLSYHRPTSLFLIKSVSIVPEDACLLLVCLSVCLCVSTSYLS